MIRLVLLCSLLAFSNAKPLRGTLFKLGNNLRFEVVDALAPLKSNDLYETLMRPVGLDREADFTRKVMIHSEDRLDFLKEALNLANKVELLTYQPYLTARYSIMPDVDQNSDDIRLLLRQVSVQEMLHLGLTMNILIAIGGSPTLWTGDQDAANYNYPLLDLFNDCAERNYEVLPASQFQLKQFFRIESERIQIPLDIQGTKFVYRGISEFYRDVDRLLVELEDEANSRGTTIFLNQDADSQIGRQFDPSTAFFFQDNSFIIVKDLETALEATNLITWQGEGAGMPVDGLDGPSHAEMFFRGMVDIMNSPIAVYDFPEQDEVLTSKVNQAILNAQIIAYNTLTLTVEKIGMLNENDPDQAKIKRMMMASKQEDNSNLSYLMSLYPSFGEFLGSRGVLMQFQYYTFDPASTPKTELLAALDIAFECAIAEGDYNALIQIWNWISDVTNKLLVDIPVVGPPKL